MMTEREAIEILWNYHHVHHLLAPSDIIFVLGSNDTRVAEYAVNLYFQKKAPIILFSGGSGRFTDQWIQTEAELFASIAEKLGTPKTAIIIENKSANSGENIRFSREILKKHGFADNISIIALQKPYMERRTYATIRAQWPEVDVAISSPSLSFEDYLNDDLPYELVVSAIVGDFQRIMEYPKQGFSIHQDIPDHSLNAFRVLVQAGFTSQLIPGVPIP